MCWRPSRVTAMRPLRNMSVHLATKQQLWQWLAPICERMEVVVCSERGEAVGRMHRCNFAWQLLWLLGNCFDCLHFSWVLKLHILSNRSWEKNVPTETAGSKSAYSMAQQCNAAYALVPLAAWFHYHAFAVHNNISVAGAHRRVVVR